MPSFYHSEVWGFDVRAFQFRARWFVRHPWSVYKDRWCWFIFWGPFEVSGHRGGLWW